MATAAPEPSRTAQRGSQLAVDHRRLGPRLALLEPLADGGDGDEPVLHGARDLARHPVVRLAVVLAALRVAEDDVAR